MMHFLSQDNSSAKHQVLRGKWHGQLEPLIILDKT